MNRRLALIGLAASTLVAAVASAQDLRRAQAAQADGLVALQGDERAAALAAANRTLNSVTRMQARFTQIAPGGSRASGTFYMQRPGKLRFQYDPPASLLIISDGSVVHMRDTALRTTERTPLRSTPLNLILAEHIDLERNARITQVYRSGAWTLVTARDRTGAVDGVITLNFYGPENDLRSWDVTDSTGQRTRIALSDVTQPAAFDRGLFRMDDMLESRPGPRGR